MSLPIFKCIAIFAYNTKLYKICKLCKAIFSVFYNILQPNFTSEVWRGMHLLRSFCTSPEKFLHLLKGRAPPLGKVSMMEQSEM
jgi:hypothetical protein